MIKKITLIFVFIFWLLSFINVWFADIDWDAWEKEAAERATKCILGSKECKINTDMFTISVNDITPWMNITEGDNVEQVVNRALWTIIQKLMIALGSLSLLIMTVWAWYMILYHGQDELLSKWKSIFLSWITALVVALSSYYIVAFLRYILYTWQK